MEEDACAKCKKTVNQDENALLCDLCEHWFHCKCVDISSSDYKCLQKISHISLWLCDRDRQKLKLIKNNSPSTEVMNHLETIVTKVNEISTAINKNEEVYKLSFAEVLKASKSPNNLAPSKTLFSYKNAKNCSKGLIVLPKTKDCSSTDVEKKIKESVNLVSIKCGVSKIKHIQKSGVFIATNNVEPLELELNKKLGADFTVTKPKQRLPLLLLSGLSREYTEDELIHEIKETNYGFDKDDIIKIQHKKKRFMGPKKPGPTSLKYHRKVSRNLSIDTYPLISRNIM